MPIDPPNRFGRFVDSLTAAWNDHAVIRIRQAGLERTPLCVTQRPLSLLALLLPLAACQQNGFVKVTVGEIDGGRGLPMVFQLRSLASDAAGGTPDLHWGPLETDAIAFPKTFVVQVPPPTTTLSEVVEGIDQLGHTVLRGSNTTNFKAGSQAIPLSINLSLACNSSLDCNPAAFCSGELSCTAEGAPGACVPNATTAPPGFGAPCGDDGGRCNGRAVCQAPFGICGDGVRGPDPQPDGGFVVEECDWGDGADGGLCTGPDGGCNSMQPDACRPNCVLPSCGDGVIDLGEKCDLGSRPSGNGTQNGCNATCTLLGNATRIVGNGNNVPGIGDAGSSVCQNNCYVDGPGNVAQFQEVGGIAILGTTLYVADTLNEFVRAVDLSTSAYNVTTLAGDWDGGPGGSIVATTVDGTGLAAGFFLPVQLLAYQGTLLVGTGMNVRQITIPGAVVTTLAGPNSGNKASENPGGTIPTPNPTPLTSAFFNKVTGLALDPTTGFLYTVDQGSG